jgi:hypothetical protein
LVPLRQKRALFAEEPRTKFPLDGNLLKTLVSGGDAIAMRQLYQNEIESSARFTLFVNANDLPTITPCDDAVLRRIRGVVEYPITFVDEIKHPQFQRLADPAVKTFLRTNVDAKDALMHILVEAWAQFKASNDVLSRAPSCVVKAREEWLGGMTVEGLLKRRFVVTGDAEDVLPFTDVFNYVVEQNNQRYTPKALSNKLKTVEGLGTEKRWFGGRTTTLVVGLRDRRDEEDESDDDTDEEEDDG